MKIERMKMGKFGAVFMLLYLLGSATAQTNQPTATPTPSVQNSQKVTVTRSGSQPAQKAPAENFTGSASVVGLFQLQVNESSRVGGASVTFEPGARTNWHSHPLGQTLIVTAGTGRVQGWGDPVEEIRIGDVVSIPPGVKHWHGAAPNSSMTHIAIGIPLNGKSVDWMEKVSDAQYNAPVAAQQPTPNINIAELTRIPENAPPQKTPPQGSYTVEVFTYPGLPTHTIYEPKSTGNALRKISVVVWGNGGCSNDNRSYRNFLTTVASHGFFIIAPGPKDATERGTTKGSVMVDALKWAEAENKRSGSPYRGRLNLDRIGLMGYSCGGLQAIENSADRRVKSVVMFNSGTFEQGTFMNQMTTANKDSLKTLHTPIAYFIGGPTDVAYPNAEDAFKRIEKVPVLKANINIGHMGTFAHPGGGWFAEAASAWLKWTLNDDKDAGSYFKGKDCKLCLDPVWNVERKNFGN